MAHPKYNCSASATVLRCIEYTNLHADCKRVSASFFSGALVRFKSFSVERYLSPMVYRPSNSRLEDVQTSFLDTHHT